MKQGKKVFLKEAIKLLNQAFGNDPEKSGRDIIAIKTLYNAISSKRLKAYGPRHMRQVDVEELMLEFGPKEDVGA
jgi:uncharacterized protein YfbU (UPF0304 family)